MTEHENKGLLGLNELIFTAMSVNFTRSFSHVTGNELLRVTCGAPRPPLKYIPKGTRYNAHQIRFRAVISLCYSDKAYTQFFKFNILCCVGSLSLFPLFYFSLWVLSPRPLFLIFHSFFLLWPAFLLSVQSECRIFFSVMFSVPVYNLPYLYLFLYSIRINFPFGILCSVI